MKGQVLQMLTQRAGEIMAHLVHELQRIRLRAERLIAGMPGRGARTRAMVFDWDGETFAGQLSRWFEELADPS